MVFLSGVGYYPIVKASLSPMAFASDSRTPDMLSYENVRFFGFLASRNVANSVAKPQARARENSFGGVKILAQRGDDSSAVR